MSTPLTRRQFEQDMGEAERLVEVDRHDRRIMQRALVAALLIHATVLWGRLPHWGPAPVRVERPAPLMQMKFLKPPPAPQPKPVEPEKKKMVRPDPTPDEPEPEVVPEAQPEAPELVGPVRVTSAEGPGLIKKVEPIYPPPARAAHIQGDVVLDAVIQQDGSVAEITVLSSANPMLEHAAVEALKHWRFTEGHQDVIMTLTVHFVLR